MGLDLFNDIHWEGCLYITRRNIDVTSSLGSNSSIMLTYACTLIMVL